MAIVRFALRFPHTFYVVAALILFLGVSTIYAMPTMRYFFISRTLYSQRTMSQFEGSPPSYRGKSRVI